MADYQPYHNGEWGIAIQYLKDGVLHIPLMDFMQPWGECGSEEKDEQEMDYNFRFLLNKPYLDHFVYSPVPKERTEGFVYDGIRVKRSPVNVSEFDQIDRSLYRYDPGYIREIWKYSFAETWRGIKTYTEHSDGKVTVDKSPLETTRK